MPLVNVTVQMDSPCWHTSDSDSETDMDGAVEVKHRVDRRGFDMPNSWFIMIRAIII